MENNKSLTAVEWLVEEIECRGIVTKELRLAFEQAKEMEKQQIIEAAERWKGTDFAEKYYAETYGSKGSETFICQDKDCKHCAEDIAQMQDEDTFKVWECCGMEECICKGIDELHEDNLEEIISQAHKNITRRKGKEYSPTHVEIQMEIDKIKGNNSEKCRMVEISDEEIEEYAMGYYNNNGGEYYVRLGAKWYREQIKSKQ